MISSRRHDGSCGVATSSLSMKIIIITQADLHVPVNTALRYQSLLAILIYRMKMMTTTIMTMKRLRRSRKNTIKGQAGKKRRRDR